MKRTDESAKTKDGKVGPLSGVQILDLTRLAPGPYGTMLLADLGADVIVVAGPGSPAVPELSRGKRFISLDLKADAGRKALRKLAARVDVLVEGFRPGVAARLGAGYEALSAVNPGLVYCSLTGYGQDGPRMREAGHLGAVGPHDGPPEFPLNLLADLGAGGLLAAFGIVAALFERTRTGRGRYIDAAMIDGCYSMLAMHVPYWGTPIMPGRGRGMVSGFAPFYRCYACADGRHVAVGPLEPNFFANFWKTLELGDVPEQFDTGRWPAMQMAIASRFLEKTRDEWAAVFAGVDACVSPILDPAEAAQDPQMRHRHAGVLPQAPVIPRFAGMPDEIAPVDMTDRTDRVLSEFGLGPEDIAAAAPRDQGGAERGFVWPPKLI
jgi:alpha-methylacyl-CoA racemase